MRPLPSVQTILPVFQNSFEAGLTHVAKAALISSLVLPVIGGIFAAPLLIATRFGTNKEAEKSPITAYAFAPLAALGVAAHIGAFAAVSTLALTVIIDLAHCLTMGGHALNYRYVFFPFKFNLFIPFSRGGSIT